MPWALFAMIFAAGISVLIVVGAFDSDGDSSPSQPPSAQQQHYPWFEVTPSSATSSPPGAPGVSSPPTVTSPPASPTPDTSPAPGPTSSPSATPGSKPSGSTGGSAPLNNDGSLPTPGAPVLPAPPNTVVAHTADGLTVAIYTVRPGDYLYKLAWLFQTPEPDIYSWSKDAVGPNPDVINPGDQVVVKVLAIDA